MAVALIPLFGTTCVGEAMPPGTDPECSFALSEAAPLRAVVERAPAPAQVSDRTFDQRPPAPEPEFSPGPSYGPGRR